LDTAPARAVPAGSGEEQPMTQAVIVATRRSPIGRALKGSLAGIRADDLMTQVVQALLDEVPALDPTTVDDLFVGAWDQSGEHAENMARRIAVQLGYDHLPAVMVNRACASSVQTTRMAANAILAGDGDVFISAGVESISRYSRQTSVGSGDPDLHNPMFAAAEEVSEAYLDSNETWHDPRTEGRLPDIYLSMGQTAENVATLCGVSREEQDAFALASQQRAAAAVADGFFAREITPIMLPDGSAVTTDDRGQCLPTQRRRRCGAGHERHPRPGAGVDAAGAHRGHRRVGVVAGDHGPGPGGRDAESAGQGRSDRRRHRPLRDQRGVRRPGHSQLSSARHRSR
jgi:hypothetical protein